MSRRKHKSGLVRFFDNVAEAAEDAVAPKAPPPREPGFGTRAVGGFSKAQSFMADETSRVIFGLVGFYSTTVIQGIVAQQSLAQQYPLISILGSAGLTYFIGTLITTKNENRKAVLLGALINAGLQIAKQYAGLAVENSKLSGYLDSISTPENQEAYSADNVYQFGHNG